MSSAVDWLMVINLIQFKNLTVNSITNLLGLLILHLLVDEEALRDFIQPHAPLMLVLHKLLIDLKNGQFIKISLINIPFEPSNLKQMHINGVLNNLDPSFEVLFELFDVFIG